MSLLNPDPSNPEAKLTDAELEMLNGPSEDGLRQSDRDAADAIAAERDDEALAEDDEQDGDSHEGQELQASDEAGQQDGKQGSEQAAEVPASWVSPEVLKYAETYGLNEYDVKAFTSQKDLEDFASRLDKYASKLIAPLAEDQQATETPAAQAASVATPAPALIPDRPGFKNGKVDLDYFKEQYGADDPIMAVVESHSLLQEQLGKTVEDFNRVEEGNQAIIAHLQRQEQQNQFNAFHNALDSIDSEFFGKAFGKDGKPVMLSDESLQRRGKVLNSAVQAIYPIVKKQHDMGLIDQMPSYNEILHRAAKAEFNKELTELDGKRKAEKLRKQSSKIRHVANTARGARPNAATRDTDPKSALMNNPKLIELWDRLEQEGSVGRG